MKYTVAVDRGNTATKAALYSGAELVHIESSTEPREAIDKLLSQYGLRPEAIIYSTVGAGGEEAMAFLRYYAPRVISLRDAEPLGITVRPECRYTLGGDRIAAAAGAYRLFAGYPLLVVDSGTAVTYDVVGADGEFLGGNIAPGMRLGLDALHRHTALLPAIEVPREYDAPLIGYDTDTAMLSGVVYGIVGAIESMSARLGADTRVVLTGGNSAIIEPLLRVPAVTVPHLVTDGLRHILTLQKV